MKTIAELRQYDPDLKNRYDDSNRPIIQPKNKLAEAIKQVMKKVKDVKDSGKTDTGQRSNVIETDPTKSELTTFH